MPSNHRALLPLAALVAAGFAAPQETTPTPTTLSSPQTTEAFSIQTTLTSMIIPYFSDEGVSPYASIIAVSSGTTSFVLQCPPGSTTTDSDSEDDDYDNECGFSPPLTVVNANMDSATKGFTYMLGSDAYGDLYTGSAPPTMACDAFQLTTTLPVDLTETETFTGLIGACTVYNVDLYNDGDSDSEDNTMTVRLDDQIWNVAVTAGAEKLESGGDAEATGTGTGTGSADGAEETGSSGGSGDDDSAAVRDGVVPLAVAGVAALAGVLLL